MFKAVKPVFFINLILLCVEAKVKLYITDSPLLQIGGRFYKKELLTDTYNDPKELAYDTLSRNLYFMYMDDDIQNSGRAFVNIITKESMKIKGIERNKATAVDADTGDVYFGSDDGLYKYDPYTNEAHNIGLYNVNVFKIVIRNGEIYIIDANNHMLYTVDVNSATVVRVGDWKTVVQFDVDHENNIHIVTMCGVYCAVYGNDTVKNKDLTTVYHFIVDEDKTLGVTDDGIYDIDCKNGTAHKMAGLDFVPQSIIHGDNGEIIYSIDNDIFRLKPVSSYFVYNVNYKNEYA